MPSPTQLAAQCLVYAAKIQTAGAPIAGRVGGYLAANVIGCPQLTKQAGEMGSKLAINIAKVETALANKISKKAGNEPQSSGSNNSDKFMADVADMVGKTFDPEQLAKDMSADPKTAGVKAVTGLLTNMWDKISGNKGADQESPEKQPGPDKPKGP